MATALKFGHNPQNFSERRKADSSLQPCENTFHTGQSSCFWSMVDNSCDFWVLILMSTVLVSVSIAVMKHDLWQQSSWSQRGTPQQQDIHAQHGQLQIVLHFFCILSSKPQKINKMLVVVVLQSLSKHSISQSCSMCSHFAHPSFPALSPYQVTKSDHLFNSFLDQ